MAGRVPSCQPALAGGSVCWAKSWARSARQRCKVTATASEVALPGCAGSCVPGATRWWQELDLGSPSRSPGEQISFHGHRRQLALQACCCRVFQGLCWTRDSLSPRGCSGLGILEVGCGSRGHDDMGVALDDQSICPGSREGNRVDTTSTPRPCIWGWLSPCSPMCHQGDQTGPFWCCFLPTRCGELRRGHVTVPGGQCYHVAMLVPTQSPSPTPGVPSQVSHRSSVSQPVLTACHKEPHEAGVPPVPAHPLPVPHYPSQLGKLRQWGRRRLAQATQCQGWGEQTGFLARAGSACGPWLLFAGSAVLLLFFTPALAPCASVPTGDTASPWRW